MVDLTSHANGAYTTEEKNNRSIFLERLGAVYHEENKTDQSIATFQKMIDLGGDSALRDTKGRWTPTAMPSSSTRPLKSRASSRCQPKNPTSS